jgi:hypothetical protein
MRDRTPLVRRPRAGVAAAWLTLLSLTGCPPAPTEALEPLGIEEGCNPLAADLDCMLPYPSNVFVVDDASTPTGKRVELSDAAKLITDEGYSADPADLHPYDGFSTTNPIVALLPAPIGRDGLTGIFDNYDPTTSSSSKTLLLDAADGTLVPHFVDVDPRAEDPSRAALVIRPQIALRLEARYVVALQGVSDTDGNVIAPPEGFRRLRDQQTAQDPALDALAGRYEREVFSPLANAGIDRASLQLAWDFSVGSEAHTIGDMLHARALALDALATTPPVVNITNVSEDPDDARYRVVFGQLTGPRVMEDDGAGQVLARDERGEVRLNGTTTFTFRAVVPRSVLERPGPAPVLIFGHGFFGSAAAASDGEYNHQLLEDAGAVALMTDWIGMAESDIGEVVSTVGGEVWLGLRFGDRVHQGVVNQLTLIHAAVNVLNGVEGFTHPDGNGPLLDTSNLTYFGISNGHILGGVLMPLDVHITKWVLQVGGASFSQMMYRALPFGRFLAFLNLRVPDALDQQKLHAQWQPSFDRFDPARYARYLDEPLPIGPPDPRGELSVLLQFGVGDTSVPNFATMLHARLLDVPMLTPSAATVWGLDEVRAEESPARALTVYDFGVDDRFYELPNPPEASNPVHEAVRRSATAVAQTAAMITEGRIIHPCDGACVLPLPDSAEEGEE